jgi:PleD family two-component response regulator
MAGLSNGVNMGKELRILILEDVPEDASLMEHELKKAGFTFITNRVETRENFVKGIQELKPNLILADYTTGTMSGDSFHLHHRFPQRRNGSGVHEVRSNRLCAEGSSRSYRPCGQGGIGENTG